MKTRFVRYGLASLALSLPAVASAQMADDREVRREVVVERQVIVERGVRPSTALTRADIERIEDRRSHAARQRMVAQKFSAADYQELRRQRREVGELIRRLEAGQTVSAAELDQALGLEHRVVVYTDTEGRVRY